MISLACNLLEGQAGLIFMPLYTQWVWDWNGGGRARAEKEISGPGLTPCYLNYQIPI
jgi:hypothetical protein